MKFAALITLGTLALAGCGVVVYTFATGDRRIVNALSTLDPFSDGEPGHDDRYASRQWSFESGDSAAVTINISDVDIRMERGAPGRVSIDLWLEGAAVEEDRFTVDVRIDEASREVLVDARPAAAWADGKGEVRLIVTLPEKVDLKLHQRNGSAQIMGAGGNVSIVSDNAPVSLSDITGSITLRSSRFPLSLERCDASASVESTGGPVTLELNKGIYLVSADGNIAARKHLGSLQASSSGGAIEAEFLSPVGVNSLSTGNGDIRIRLLAASRASLDLESPIGGVQNHIAIDSTELQIQEPGKLRAGLNGGGASVKATSRRGVILLEGVE